MLDVSVRLEVLWLTGFLSQNSSRAPVPQIPVWPVLPGEKSGAQSQGVNDSASWGISHGLILRPPSGAMGPTGLGPVFPAFWEGTFQAVVVIELLVMGNLCPGKGGILKRNSQIMRIPTSKKWSISGTLGIHLGRPGVPRTLSWVLAAKVALDRPDWRGLWSSR